MRAFLVNEPRGHADMYGCFVTDPVAEGSDLGVLFFHNAGFSTACGHGTIALATAALETGMLPAGEPRTELRIDVPSGTLPVTATVADGRVGVGELSERPRLRPRHGRPGGDDPRKARRGRRVRRGVLREPPGRRRRASRSSPDGYPS